MMQPLWKIELFGGLKLRYNDAPHRVIRSRNVSALLAYLAFYPDHQHTRDTLIERLWPDGDPSEKRLDLRVTLSGLRRCLALSDAESATLLIANRSHVALRSGAFTTDVMEFENACQEAERASVPAAKAFYLERAVTLYTGELLAGQDAEWILPEQERLGEMYQSCLRQLAQAARDNHEPGRAIDYMLRAKKRDPFEETWYRELMRLYAEDGRRREAEKTYCSLQRMLKKFEEAPSAATRMLLKQIRQNPQSFVLKPKPAAIGAERTLQPAGFLSHLPETHQAFLARLSVFHETWTAEAAAIVCEAPNADELLDVLQLRSLVAVQTVGNETRYRFEKMWYTPDFLALPAAERHGLSQRHAAYYDRWLLDIEPRMSGEQLTASLDRFEWEHTNIQAALLWAVENNAPYSIICRMPLLAFWNWRKHLGTIQEWLLACVLPMAKTWPQQHAYVLSRLGSLATELKNDTEAIEWMKNALALFRMVNDRDCIAGTCCNLAYLMSLRADYAQARVYQQKSIAILRGLGKTDYVAIGLRALGTYDFVEGKPREARAYYQEALALFDSVQNRSEALLTHTLLAQAECLSGAMTAGLLRFSAALSELEAAGATRMRAILLRHRAEMYQSSGNAAMAHADYVGYLTLAVELRLVEEQIAALCLLAHLALSQSEGQRAARLLSAIEAFNERRDLRPPPLLHRYYASARAQLESLLDAPTLESAWQAGRALPFADAITVACKPLFS